MPSAFRTGTTYSIEKEVVNVRSQKQNRKNYMLICTVAIHLYTNVFITVEQSTVQKYYKLFGSVNSTNIEFKLPVRTIAWRESVSQPGPSRLE